MPSTWRWLPPGTSIPPSSCQSFWEMGSSSRGDLDRNIQNATIYLQFVSLSIQISLVMMSGDLLTKRKCRDNQRKAVKHHWQNQSKGCLQNVALALT
jgi:hypothetical protein